MMDPERLGSLVEQYSPGLLLYARQFCAVPEDVVQEAFLKLMGQTLPPERIAAWLYRVVRNLAISEIRALNRRRRLEQRADSQTWFEPANLELGVDSVIAAEALAKLPDDEREIITLHFWGGLTFAEIAEVVGKPSSTVHRRYAAGLTNLRERLQVPCPTKTPQS